MATSTASLSSGSRADEALGAHPPRQVLAAEAQGGRVRGWKQHVAQARQADSVAERWQHALHHTAVVKGYWTPLLRGIAMHGRHLMGF